MRPARGDLRHRAAVSALRRRRDPRDAGEPADRSRKAERKLATVAAQTLQDAIQRSAIAAGADPLAVSPGLRGGSSSVDATDPEGNWTLELVDDPRSSGTSP